MEDLLGEEPDVALVAVGGYGRRDLCPGSDLDLVLLHRGRPDIAEVADRVWYPIWDSGIRLDHSVRTVKEALDVADSDLKVMLGLQTARHVAGDAALTDRLAQEARDRWRNGARRWLTVLRDHVAARHERFGEVAFLLEPDIKEGRGGLRDVHAVRLARDASPVVDEPVPAVDAAYDLLLTIRVELQRRTGRADDRLLLELQDDVARTLGVDADQLMASVAQAARSIAWCGDDSWRRVTSWIEGPKGRSSGADRVVGDGIVVRDGEVALTADADIDSATALRVGAASAQTGASVDRSTLARLVEEVPTPPDPWPEPTRQALVALLREGRPAVGVVETLDQHGLMARLLPEWLAVRSKPQRNAYHRFTVDRHLCETAANAAALADNVERPDLLVVGALLHDIGKGFPGDHTVVGMERVERIGRRMGFGADDVGLLMSMVEHHLLLPHVATRRDLSDPRTAEAVAAAVGRRDLLELLGALTEADSLATGPSAWSDWKAALVAELVARTGAVLDGAGVPEPEPRVREEHRAAIGKGEVSVEVEGDQVTVVAPDRPGLFARVAGVLALHGLDVRGASAAGEAGMAVEVFDVDTPFGPPDWRRVEGDLARAVHGPFALQARLADRDRTYAPARPTAPGVSSTPKIEWDDEASASSTVVEVRTLDRIGVLYRITRALAECELNVQSARVSTLGDEVVDAFYVVDASGAKVMEPAARAEVERAVHAALDGP